MSEQLGSSQNKFIFADQMDVTINTDYLTILAQSEEGQTLTDQLQQIYVLMLEGQDNAFIVYEKTKNYFEHFELEHTPKKGPIIEQFIGFLTIRMPYIFNINGRYLEKLDFSSNVKLQKGWRLSFHQHDYVMYPSGPSRGLTSNSYFVCHA
jgi:hypothetical protein